LPKTLDAFLAQPRVGYFSMEIALRCEIPTYSGGLGVLAGDTLRSAADLEVPMVGVTLVSRQGYFRQSIDAGGRQCEAPDPWQPERWAAPLPAKVAVAIDGRTVWVGGWLYVIEARAGGCQPVVLLDTHLPENAEADRGITDHLYGGDAAYRLCQEIVLGIGGVRLLAALGFAIDAYHLNEGHSALLTLQLLKRLAPAPERLREGEARYDPLAVRQMCHFTTHTPVEAGHDRFPYELAQSLLGDFVELDTLRRFAGEDELNTTRLALNLCGHVNGVAKSHAETSRRLFPGYEVGAITNGVHPRTWTHPALARLYDTHIPGWCVEPTLLMHADHALADEQLWAAHGEAKTALCERVGVESGVGLDPELPILGYARRMTQYKRPELLFSDRERLLAICRDQPFQVVLAGKAHPRDGAGKEAIAELHRLVHELAGTLRIAFLPNYDLDTALAMVAGVDLWLNTPKPPLEASGTSGMKAALNGVPSLSVLDGWWVEGHIEGVTGWAVGNGDAAQDADAADATDLYAKLEHTVLPAYARREAWVAIMKGAIARNGSVFHSHRMIRRYVAEAYLGRALRPR